MPISIDLVLVITLKYVILNSKKSQVFSCLYDLVQDRTVTVDISFFYFFL